MKTYRGSCFCAAVAFEADGDLADGTMRCNCRFCRKMRYWELRLPQADGLRILCGAEMLAETPRAEDDGIDMHHVFCRRCGTRLWTRGTIAEMGGRFTAVFVPALDDVPQADLVAAPVFHADGAHDDWGNPAVETRHL
ncbi:Glutathione-dependent formaldehyde-activating enzyme [Paracoccus haematequi]|uniref:Glutathione-dependent formaldehyde-activating enzyme n=1 Tax=Paracoccus haematequi TaxID=2491866 RepID=A0A3S4DYJ9_9RHOB|nr:GFA family protein [Paracoccus haematequi]VDS10385.1 Glutathione-dependent formaldehyde-activating enzyme [Paracoccus haematequi]